MTDVALLVTQGETDFGIDIGLAGADLATDNGLNTAILISLFSDARAADDDVLPVAGGDRRGWWGDAYAETPGDVTGSKLWLLERSKQTPGVLLQAQQYAQDALAWLIDDGVAAAVDVVASYPQKQAIGLLVTVTKPDGSASAKFSYVWKNP